MDERTATVNIGGQEYEMLLTTRATKAIAGRYGGLENLGQRDDDLRCALHHSRKALDDAGEQRGQHLHPGVYKLRQHGNRRVHQSRNGPGEGFIRTIHAVYQDRKSVV